jgi:hypothetical protein
MTRAALFWLVTMLIVPTDSRAQVDPFSGIWTLNHHKSVAVWEAMVGRATNPLPKTQTLNVRVIDRKAQQSGESVSPTGGVTRYEFSATYNDGAWYPVFNQATKTQTGTVMVIRVDPRHEIRINRQQNGNLSNIMHRELSEDGGTVTSIVSRADGRISTIHVFDKQR